MEVHLIPIEDREVWVIEIDLPNMQSWTAISGLAKNLIGYLFGPLHFTRYGNVQDFRERAPEKIRNVPFDDT